MAQLVRDVMSDYPVVVSPHTSVQQVASLFREGSVDTVFVADQGRLRGWISARDLSVGALALVADLSEQTVEQIWEGAPLVVAPDDNVDRAVQLMLGQCLLCLPVIDDGRLIGIVRLNDIAPTPGQSLTRSAL